MCDTKKCTKCGRELPLDQFHKKKSGQLGLGAMCKDCVNARASEFRRNNPGKIKAQKAKYYQDNKDKIKVANAKWQRNNPEKVSIRNARWRKNNPEKARVLSRKWQKDNPEKERATKTKYKRERKFIDLSYKLMENTRAAMRSALRDNAKSGHTIELLGCSIEYLRKYLEDRFMEGMSWDNYGLYGWHIDHIIPLSYFHLDDPEQQKHAWHYTNLQPLWAADNFIKSNKIEERQLVLL